jgi:LPS-assembly protein
MRGLLPALGVLVAVFAHLAHAQGTSGDFVTRPRADRTQPLYLQADELIYDTRGNRVIARGNVEMYYNNYILTADRVTYDESSNKLTAEGNAQLKDPDGTITRADRFEALDHFRDAFVESLAATPRLGRVPPPK